MICTEARELIGSYVEDGLSLEVRARVEAHLFICPDCAWDALTLTITRTRLREGAGDVTASDAFRTRAFARLHADNPHLATSESTATDPAQYTLPIQI